MTKDEDEEDVSINTRLQGEMIGSNSATETTSLLSISDDNDDINKGDYNYTAHSLSNKCSNENGVRDEINAKEEDAHDQKEKEDASYADIILSNRPFRLYLFSYLITHAGEWFTYVASIELMEQILGTKKSQSRRYVSCLVVCRLLPNFVLIPFGGVLADARDRRHSMIMLDAIGAIAPLFYLAASYFRSIEMIYMVTLLQASIAALYEPCRTSIIPLMVTDNEPMKKATTLAGLAWSMMTAIGSGAGGYMVSQIGVNACFILDSFSFIISGFLMYLVGGEWNVNVADDNDDDDDGGEHNAPTRSKHLSVWRRAEDMAISGFKYIMEGSFRPLVFIKVSASLVYGGGDILNVSFAEEDPTSTEKEQSQRLGALFFMVGAGCLLGPILLDPFTNMKNPMTILNVCVGSFAVQAVGCTIMGLFTPFSFAMLGAMIRAAGSSIAWIDSQILLQTVVKPEMLGRVVAVDYGLALLTESLSAVIVGSVLQDDLDLNALQVSTIMGIVAFVLFIGWLIFRFKGGEAALAGY